MGRSSYYKEKLRRSMERVRKRIIDFLMQQAIIVQKFLVAR